MELFSENKYKVISVDSGYGETQIELMHARLLAKGVDPDGVLTVVDSVKKVKQLIEYTSPQTGARRKDEINIRMKTFIVSLLGKYLEFGLVLPKEEDFMYNRTGIVSEIRGFRRKETGTGSFDYSEAHSVSAIQMCVYGLDEWEKKGNRIPIEPVRVAEPISAQAYVSMRMGNMRNNAAPLVNERIINGRRTGGLSGRTGRAII